MKEPLIFKLIVDLRTCTSFQILEATSKMRKVLSFAFTDFPQVTMTGQRCACSSLINSGPSCIVYVCGVGRAGVEGKGLEKGRGERKKKEI